MSYYDFVGDIKPGWLAKSETINLIQDHIDNAFAQLIMDNFGIAYVLDGKEDAFKLTPVQTIYDQKQEEGSTWKSLEQVYLSQLINLTKSSINQLILKFKNENEESVPVKIKLMEPIEENITGKTLYSGIVNVTPGEKEYQINISLNNLTQPTLLLVIERTNIPGVYVLYKNTQVYNGSLSESIDRYTYQNIGGDLYFKTIYATSTSYDIQNTYCMILGEKFIPITTHVDISPGSPYGNRIDIVYITSDQTIEVAEGDPALDPEPPLNKIPPISLRIAEIYVPKGETNIENFRVSQNDFLGQYRLRGHHERLRRLEKWANFMYQYNSPGRIKYTLTGNCFKDETRSYGISYDPDIGGYVLSTENAQPEPDPIIKQKFTKSATLTWTLKNPSQINQDRCYYVGFDFTKGEISLSKYVVTSQTPPTKITYTTVIPPQQVIEQKTVTKPKTVVKTIPGKTTQVVKEVLSVNKLPHTPPTKTRAHFPHNVYYSTTKKSDVVGVFFYNKDEGLLDYIKIGLWDYSNIYQAKIILFSINQEKKRMDPIISSNWHKFSSHFSKDPITVVGKFNRNYWIKPGWYAAVVLMSPYAYRSLKGFYHNIPWRGNLKTEIPPIPPNWKNNKGAVYDLLIKCIYPSSVGVPNDPFADHIFIPQADMFLSYGEESKMFPGRYVPYLYRAYTNAMDVEVGVITKKTETIKTPDTVTTEEIMVEEVVDEVVTIGGGTKEETIEIPGATSTLILLRDGIIESAPSNTPYDITEGTIQANIVTPGKSRYKIEVSNDGGQTFVDATSGSFKFTELGKSFVWRITLSPSDDNQSPALKYSEALGYAVKADLKLTGEEEVTIPQDHGDIGIADGLQGCLVTPPFNGDQIIQEALENESQRFSHWEWSRIWATGPKSEEEETNSYIRINVECSDDGTKWNKIFSDLRLKDLYNGSIDYSHYTAAYEEDEYNFYLGLESDIITNREPLYTTPILLDGGELGILRTVEVNGAKFRDGKYLLLKIKSNKKMRQGVLTLILSSDNEGKEIIQKFRLPVIPNQDEYIHTILKLTKKYSIEDIKYLHIYANDSFTSNIEIKDIYVYKGNSYPLYGKYLRIRVCMGRSSTSIPSPVVRKVGVVPITT